LPYNKGKSTEKPQSGYVEIKPGVLLFEVNMSGKFMESKQAKRI
jgi:hypothetical protein